MKKLLVTGIVAALMLVGAAAYAAPKHPNIHAAHQLIVQALGRIQAAEKANEYDLGGHAAKAKDLLVQAEAELRQAAQTSNAEGK